MKETKIQLSNHARSEIDRWIAKYPADRKQSAVLAALREVQHENQGYLTTELMDAVAEYLEMPPIAVYEVGSFYSMLETEKCGRHSISVCTNISCMLNGLAACCGAPMMMVDHVYHENLTPEKVDEILDKLE